MYNLFYELIMRFLQVWIHLTALFSEKNRLRCEGEKALWGVLEKASTAEKYIWIHAASYGEFEQGCPIIEKIKAEQPTAKILLTFFSPSGYEACKNYSNADIVCYLPIDTHRNAMRFLQQITIEKAIFVKYEFWYNILQALYNANIPVYLASGIFRPQQIFFKFYGKSYSKVLNYFTHFFVQNSISQVLLERNGLKNITVAGDTRFDRVQNIASSVKELPIVQAFTRNSEVLVAGSTWEQDEEIVIRYFNTTPGVKLIIAPHEIRKSRISFICSRLQRQYLKYSEATEQNIKQADCLIIDCIGLLSSVYQFGKLAYIGGGFGGNIHNLLEAAVWKIPVIFGPNYRKSQEACDLIEQGGAFSIKNFNEFSICVDKLQKNTKAGEIAGRYVASNVGATEQIYNYIFTNN